MRSRTLLAVGCGVFMARSSRLAAHCAVTVDTVRGSRRRVEAGVACGRGVCPCGVSAGATHSLVVYAVFSLCVLVISCVRRLIEASGSGKLRRVQSEHGRVSMANCVALMAH
jgi:hypothetical protein